MGNYASKDGSEETSNAHDSNAIPSRNTNGGVALRPFRAEEQTQRVASDEQALILEGDMDNSVRTVNDVLKSVIISYLLSDTIWAEYSFVIF